MAALLNRLFPRGGSTPLGVFTRSRWDWLLPGALSSWGTQAAVAAQFGFVGLYNNTNSGKVLSVFAVFIATGAAGNLLDLSFTYSKPGSVARAGFALWVGQPVGDGQIVTGSQAAQPAPIFAKVVPAAGDLFPLFQSEPVARVPPGYALLASADVVNQAIGPVTFFWVPELV